MLWKLIGGVLGSVFGNLIGGLFRWFQERRAINDAKKQGRTEQANVDLQATDQAITEAKDVANTVNSVSKPELDGLRDEWTR